MEDTAIQFWTGLGAFLMLLEFLVPGLVVVFVGLGALTVAAGLYSSWIVSLPAQLSVWFISTLIYTFTLRLLIVRLYPSDREKVEMNEDQMLTGMKAIVTETITQTAAGRVVHGDTTWNATGNGEETMAVGTTVFVTGRDNITLQVQSSAPPPVKENS